MAQLTYSGTWSKEGLATSPIKLPRQRPGKSPRARSRSVHSPQRGTPSTSSRGLRFASGQHSIRPVRLFEDEYQPGWEPDWEPEWESEDSLYFENSPMLSRRRERSPERGVRSEWREPNSRSQMTWLRLVVNLGVMVCALALTLKALFTIQADLVIKFAQARADLVAEIDSCRRSYTSNHCPNDAPLLVHACYEWEKCMNLDPDKAGQVRATAAALGEIIQAFVGRLDLRSMVVLMAVGIVVVYWK